MKATEGNRVVTPPTFCKCNIVWGTRYNFERVSLRQPDIFATHRITNQPRWNITLRCTDPNARYKVLLHQLNNDGICRHSGKCQVVRKPGVIVLSTSHMIPGYHAVTLSALTSEAKEFVTTMVLLLQFIIGTDPLAERVDKTNKDKKIQLANSFIIHTSKCWLIIYWNIQEIYPYVENPCICTNDMIIFWW